MLLQWENLTIPLGVLLWVETTYHSNKLQGTFDLVDATCRTLRFSEVDLTYPLWISLEDVVSVEKVVGVSP